MASKYNDEKEICRNISFLLNKDIDNNYKSDRIKIEMISIFERSSKL